MLIFDNSAKLWITCSSSASVFQHIVATMTCTSMMGPELWSPHWTWIMTFNHSICSQWLLWGLAWVIGQSAENDQKEHLLFQCNWANSICWWRLYGCNLQTWHCFVSYCFQTVKLQNIACIQRNVDSLPVKILIIELREIADMAHKLKESVRMIFTVCSVKLQLWLSSHSQSSFEVLTDLWIVLFLYSYPAWVLLFL